MEYFYWVDSNQILFAFCLTCDDKIAVAFKAVAWWFFFFFFFNQVNRMSTMCESINNSIKSLNGKLNYSALLWEKMHSECFATCSPPILKTVFSDFEIYGPGAPCCCLVDNLWVPHSCWKATNKCHCLFRDCVVTSSSNLSPQIAFPWNHLVRCKSSNEGHIVP